MRNQKGFGALHLLLVLVIVGIVGATGWYVYKSQKSVDSSLSNLDIKEQPKDSGKTKLTSEPQTICAKQLCIKTSDPFLNVTKTEDKELDYISYEIQHLSNDSQISFNPFVDGIGGVCDKNMCFFKTLALETIEKMPHVYLVKGVFSSVNEETGKIDTYSYTQSVMDKERVEEHKLKIGETTDVGFFGAFFSPVKGGPIATALLSYERDKDWKKDPFSTMVEAESHSKSDDALAAAKIQKTLYYK